MAPHAAVPPPQSLRLDQPFAVEDAQRHLRAAAKRFPRARRARSTQQEPAPEVEPQLETATRVSFESQPPDLVNVQTTPGSEGDEKDVYAWAILFENQRGFTFLSTPYYSAFGLFPFDPPPFTIPDTHPGAKQPKVSLTEYPLPDGNWHWVSKSWMVDMREDGAVQYDGWEFNWRFRQRGWRSHVGHLSAGGFVRRRRWVRLMMRPAASQPRPVPDASAPPSAINTPVLPPDDRTDDIWQGKLDADWARYQVLMRNIGSDGHRLDLWRRWLQPTGDTAAAVFAPLRSKQWTEDSDYMPSELQDEEVRSRAKPSPLTNRDAVAAVVRAHGKDILRSFAFPSSRDELLRILARAGLLADVASAPLGVDLDAEIADITDFWSYGQDLAEGNLSAAA